MKYGKLRSNAAILLRVPAGEIYQMNSRVLSSLNIPEKLKSCFYTTYCDILLKQSVKIIDGCALSQESNLKAVAHFFI